MLVLSFQGTAWKVQRQRSYSVRQGLQGQQIADLLDVSTDSVAGPARPTTWTPASSIRILRHGKRAAGLFGTGSCFFWSVNVFFKEWMCNERTLPTFAWQVWDRCEAWWAAAPKQTLASQNLATRAKSLWPQISRDLGYLLYHLGYFGIWDILAMKLYCMIFIDILSYYNIVSFHVHLLEHWSTEFHGGLWCLWCQIQGLGQIQNLPQVTMPLALELRTQHKNCLVLEFLPELNEGKPGKIICKWGMFNCHVWILEGRLL